MGDVAVTPNPTADQLAQIAYTTAHTAQSVAGITDPPVSYTHLDVYKRQCRNSILSL